MANILENLSVWKKIKDYFYNKAKKQVINKIDAKENGDYHYAYNFERIKSPFNRDLDVVGKLINKGSNEFANTFSRNEKEMPFFKAILKDMKKDEDFLKIEIPDDKSFENFHIIQKLLREEEVDFVSLDDELKKDPDIYALCLSKNPSLIAYFIDDFLDNISVANEVVKVANKKFKNFSERVRSDPNVCVTALIYDENSFTHIGDSLKKSEEFLLRALKYQEKIFPLINSELRLDDRFREKAVDINYFLLEYVHEKARDDEYMLKRVQKDPYALIYAGEDLKNDFHLVRSILKKNVNVYNDISARLRANKELALLAVNINGYNLSVCSDELRDDYDVAKAAVLKDNRMGGYMSNRLRGDKKLVLEILGSIDKKEDFLPYIRSSLFNDEEVVSEMLKNKNDFTVDFVNRVPEKLRENTEIMKKRLMISPEKVIEYEEKRFGYLGSIDLNKTEYEKVKKFMKEMIEINPITMKYISEKFKMNKEFYFENEILINQNKEVLEEDFNNLRMFLREKELNETMAERNVGINNRTRKKI